MEADKKLAILSVLCAAGADFGRAMRDLREAPLGGYFFCQYSVLQLALNAHKLAYDQDVGFIAYLLDVAGMDARMACDIPTMKVAFEMARQGSVSIPFFKLLVARGFDIKALNAVEYASDNEFTDNLLGFAAARDTELLRYFVKDLGISGSSSEVRAICLGSGNFDSGTYMEQRAYQLDRLKAGAVPENPLGISPDASEDPGTAKRLSKFSCDFCKKVDRVHPCSRCHRARYCCKNCQMSHWKTAHKAECRVVSTSPKAGEGEAANAGGAGQS